MRRQHSKHIIGLGYGTDTGPTHADKELLRWANSTDINPHHRAVNPGSPETKRASHCTPGV